MAILTTIKKFIPYVKTTAGYVAYRLSSQAVQMDNGKTLEATVSELNSKLEKTIQIKTKETRLNVTAGQRTYSYITLDTISGYNPVISIVYPSHVGTLVGGTWMRDEKVWFMFDAKTTTTPETFVAITLYVKTALL